MTPYYQDDWVTIYHGDCREVMSELGGADLIVTDPPYGETSHAWDRWPNGWVAIAAQQARSMWCWGSVRMFLDHKSEFADWRLSQDVVWEKDDSSHFATDRFRRVHEHALHWYRGPWGEIYHAPPREKTFGQSKGTIHRKATVSKTFGARGASTYVDDGHRLIRSIIYCDRVRYVEGQHSTEKPVRVMEPLIEYGATTGTLILDPFAGSGTTLVAAKALRRRSIGIEADEQWCEIAARRCSQEVLGLAG